jgi:uncharacterized protein YbjT (DUF2867 family)
MSSTRTVAVTAPCGSIGQILLDRLRCAGVQINAMSVNVQKLPCSSGMRKIAGNIHDPNDLRRLLDGADTLFWATPPDFQSSDLLDWYRRAGESAASAIEDSPIQRIVHLSSLGAELGPETGLVYGHRLIEEQLNGMAPHVMHLRSAYFMENFLTCLLSIGSEKRICRPVSAQRSFPMVATADVARIAAELLLDESWQGQCSREILGPEDLCLEQAVGILSEELGQTISFEKVESLPCLDKLTDIGMGESMAALLVRTYEWIEAGTPDYASRRDPNQHWEHDFRSFVRQTFVPIYSTLS